MSVSAKSGVEEIDSINFSKKSAQILEAISTRLKFVRSKLSPKQFSLLMEGRIDVNEFLRHTETQRPKPDKYNRMQSLSNIREDSLPATERNLA